MASAPLWITEADVTSLLSLGDAIPALERALRLEARGEAANLPKAHLMVGANDVGHDVLVRRRATSMTVSGRRLASGSHQKTT